MHESLKNVEHKWLDNNVTDSIVINSYKIKQLKQYNYKYQ